ncbi:MAG: hypothetical protein AB7S38_13465 [Vulcanimicrobiota bacterium]
MAEGADQPKPHEESKKTERPIDTGKADTLKSLGSGTRRASVGMSFKPSLPGEFHTAGPAAPYDPVGYSGGARLEPRFERGMAERIRPEHDPTNRVREVSPRPLPDPGRFRLRGELRPEDSQRPEPKAPTPIISNFEEQRRALQAERLKSLLGPKAEPEVGPEPIAVAPTEKVAAPTVATSVEEARVTEEIRPLEAQPAIDTPSRSAKDEQRDDEVRLRRALERARREDDTQESKLEPEHEQPKEKKEEHKAPKDDGPDGGKQKEEKSHDEVKAKARFKAAAKRRTASGSTTSSEGAKVRSQTRSNPIEFTTASRGRAGDQADSTSDTSRDTSSRAGERDGEGLARLDDTQKQELETRQDDLAQRANEMVERQAARETQDTVDWTGIRRSNTFAAARHELIERQSQQLQQRFDDTRQATSSETRSNSGGDGQDQSSNRDQQSDQQHHRRHDSDKGHHRASSARANTGDDGPPREEGMKNRQQDSEQDGPDRRSRGRTDEGNRRQGEPDGGDDRRAHRPHREEGHRERHSEADKRRQTPERHSERTTQPESDQRNAERRNEERRNEERRDERRDEKEIPGRDREGGGRRQQAQKAQQEQDDDE